MSASTPVEVVRGNAPIVLAFPHTGTYIPDPIASSLNDNGRRLSDTDWHVDLLYDGLLSDVTTVRATFHRYLVDANRDPSGQSLYPGLNTTGLIPTTDFDGREIWQKPPTDADIADRLDTYHAPYHAALASELDRVQALHGTVILYDCHSIRGDIPFLFSGRLPDFNIGTNMGKTCAPEIENAVVRICEASKGHSSVLNGRFKGGWTTRHYGQRAIGRHAIQMELAQSTYLSEEAPPWTYDKAKASSLRTTLAEILESLSDIASTQQGAS